jgi:hypothetical protein
MTTGSFLGDLVADSLIVRQPVAEGSGYWVGAPGVFYESIERTWYLTYRIRRPRGVAPDRGGEAKIARSTDLKTWEDILTVTKDQFGSPSIERSTLRKGPDGLWHYFVSYVDPADNRWCVSQMSSRDIRALDPKSRRPLFTAQTLGLEGVKDPWIYEDAGKFYMLLSVATPTPKTSTQSHSTADIFNTGECVSATALAVSNDLNRWEWKGLVLKPRAGKWDQYCRRLNSVVPVGRKLLGFYDGSAGHHENYEEKCGLAISNDWREWESLTPDGPVFISPHGSKSLRYVDAQPDAGGVCLFFEFARPDGSHDLRLAKCSRESLAQLIQ